MQNNIEQKMARIEEIVAIIDKGETGLDDSIKLYEEATTLTAECRKYIDSAEQKIIDITKKVQE